MYLGIFTKNELETGSDKTGKLLEMCHVNRICVICVTSSLTFYQKLAVLQLVDVPENILNFVNIGG